MKDNKNNLEIVSSFKTLLKKAEQLSYEKKTEKLLENKKKLDNKKIFSNIENPKGKKDIEITNSRLGIKNIKRLPHHPFKNSSKLKSEDYEKYKNELTIKISSIVNKQIKYWLLREMPKYVRIKLRKNIYSLLINISNK